MALAVAVALSTACAVSPGLEDCAADGEEEAEAKVLAEAFESSTHELITCGQLVTTFAKAVIETAAVWAGGDALPPEAYTYEDGLYRTVGEGVAMDLELVRGAGTPGGATGSALGADIFDLDSWLVGAALSNDGDDVLVDFTAPGPLVALLGQGPNPTSPLRLTLSDLDDIVLNVASIEIVGDIWVDDTRGQSTLTWHVSQVGGAVGDVVATGAVDVSRVKDGSGVRGEQTLKTTRWDVVYVDPSALNGTIVAEVVGGSFDYEVTWDYIGDGSPVVTYTCL